MVTSSSVYSKHYYASSLGLKRMDMTYPNALTRARENKWDDKRINLMREILASTSSNLVHKEWIAYYAATFGLNTDDVTYLNVLTRARENKWDDKKLNLIKERLASTSSNPVKEEWIAYYAATFGLNTDDVTYQTALKCANESQWPPRRLLLLEERLGGCSPIEEGWTDVLANLLATETNNAASGTGNTPTDKIERNVKNLCLSKQKQAVRKVGNKEVLHIMGNELGGSVKDKCLAIIRIVFPDTGSTLDHESTTKLKAYIQKKIRVNCYDFIHVFKYGGTVKNFKSVTGLRYYSEENGLIMPKNLAKHEHVEILRRELFSF